MRFVSARTLPDYSLDHRLAIRFIRLRQTRQSAPISPIPVFFAPNYFLRYRSCITNSRHVHFNPSNMKKLYIIKTGTTLPAVAERFGDFDRWIAAELGTVGIETCVVDAEHGAAAPPLEACAGAVITGSPTMVTERLPWSVALERWLQILLAARVPVLGICYGHQLLAQAAGGRVGYHPGGKEIGTVDIRLLPGCADDPLFASLPSAFPAHATHAQSVLELPAAAIRLAANDHDPNHAFRLGDCAWGVQFHPEFNADVMRAYIEVQREQLYAAGFNTEHLLNSVVETPTATGILARFGAWLVDRMAEPN